MTARKQVRVRSGDQQPQDEWPTATMTAMTPEELAPLESDRDFGTGVLYNPAMDVLILKTGSASTLSIRPGKRLAEVLAAGFARLEEADRAVDTQEAHGATKCPYCGSSIIWVRMTDLRGTETFWHPLDAKPSENGTVKKHPDSNRAWKIMPGDTVTGKLYASHVGSCPGMAEGDNRRKGPEGNPS